MASRFIVCDGLSAAAGSGAASARARTRSSPGCPMPTSRRARAQPVSGAPGRPLLRGARQARPQGGRRVRVVTEDASFARRAVEAVAEIAADAPVLVLSDPLEPAELPSHPCLRATGLRTLIRDDVDERVFDPREPAPRRANPELLERREKVGILLQPDPDPDGIAGGYALRALLGRRSPTSPLISFGEVKRPGEPGDGARARPRGADRDARGAGRVRRAGAGRRAADRLRREPSRARAVGRRRDRPPPRAQRLRRGDPRHPTQLWRDVDDPHRVHPGGETSS